MGRREEKKMKKTRRGRAGVKNGRWTEWGRSVERR